MAEFDVLDIERDAAAFARDTDHLIRVDKQNSRLRIEETTDEPGASDAVDFRPPPCHPNARPFWRKALKFCSGDERQACFCPSFISAIEHTCVDAVGAQLRDRALTHFVTAFARDDDGPGRIEFGLPLPGLRGIAPDGAGQQLWRLFVNVTPAHLDELRCVTCRDCIPEIFR
jgi:hypothetical protein